MKSKKYWLRITVLIFTFLYAYAGTAAYRYIRVYLFAGDAARTRTAGCSNPFADAPDETVYKNRSHLSANLDLSGDYYIANPTVPASFRGIEYLEIKPQWYDFERMGPEWAHTIEPGGALHEDGEQKLIWASSTPGAIAFETEAAAGTAYRFVGRATEWSTFDGGATSTEISGTLYKVRFGRIVDSMYAVFNERGC
jgi:hypothetical protein